jgi:hypothetical protein
LISPPFVSWSIDGLIIIIDVPPEIFYMCILCVDFLLSLPLRRRGTETRFSKYAKHSFEVLVAVEEVNEVRQCKKLLQSRLRRDSSLGREP